MRSSTSRLRAAVGFVVAGPAHSISACCPRVRCNVSVDRGVRGAQLGCRDRRVHHRRSWSGRLDGRRVDEPADRPPYLARGLFGGVVAAVRDEAAADVRQAGHTKPVDVLANRSAFAVASQIQHRGCRLRDSEAQGCLRRPLTFPIDLSDAEICKLSRRAIHLAFGATRHNRLMPTRVLPSSGG